MCPQWKSNPRLPACKASTLSTRPGSPLFMLPCNLYCINTFTNVYQRKPRDKKKIMNVVASLVLLKSATPPPPPTNPAHTSAIGYPVTTESSLSKILITAFFYISQALNASKTYKSIMVKQFYEDIWWLGLNSSWVTIDLYFFKYKCLIPSRTQTLVNVLCSHTLMNE